MSTIVEAAIPAAQFALAEATRRLPEATFQAVRVVAQGSGRPIPLLRVAGDDSETLVAALDADGTVEDVGVLARQHDTVLCQVEWSPQVRILLDLLVDEGGAILDARGTDGTWTLRVLLPEREAVAAIVAACDRYDLDLQVERIASAATSIDVRQSTLTEEQFRTVQSALEHGYYEIPRRTTLSELSGELGVSHQALSERLRRGHRQLVETALGNRHRIDSGT